MTGRVVVVLAVAREMVSAFLDEQANRIERCFSRPKHFRRFATRYERRNIHFRGLAFLAASMIWTN